MLNDMPGARAAAPPKPRKVLLYCWVSQCLDVLVPKIRGTGYMRAPYYHGNNPGLNRVADSIRADVSGLDGSLNFSGPDIRKAFINRTTRAEIIATMIPLLEAHYRMDSREIDTVDFWELHPLQQSTP